MLEQITEAWRTNNRITIFLIDNISEDGMACSLSKRGGRTVARQLGHMHTNRVWQLENRARELSKGLVKFGAADEPDADALRAAFAASGDAVEQFFADCVAGVPKRRSFKKGVVAHLSYFIAHESHHRGNILLTLKECGHNLDQNTRYAIWNWDKL